MLRRLVCGVGVNDANYTTERRVERFGPFIKKTYKLEWRCPFFQRWYNMIQRCYSNEKRLRVYKDCTVFESWLTFSNFKRWMEGQKWEGRVLDKDLLVPGNKVYSPDTCIFISQEVNKFLIERIYNRGQYKIGVSKAIGSHMFRADCSDGSGNNIYLGSYSTEEEAHKSWINEKIRQAKILALKESDPRVISALINRYENYQEV